MSGKEDAMGKTLDDQRKASKKDVDLRKREESVGKKSLLSAVMKDELSDAVLLLFEGSSLNHVNENGDSLLHIASSKGHSEIVDLLLKYGAKIDCENDDGLSPLHVAIIAGHLEPVKLLLNASLSEGKYKLIETQSKASNNLNYTPLQLSAKYGHHKIVEFLIKCGANVDAKLALTKYGSYETALHLAIIGMYKKCIMLLLKLADKRGIKKDQRIIYCAVAGTSYYNKFHERSIRKMSKYEQLLRGKMIGILLDAGAQFYDNVTNPHNALHLAIMYNRYWLVKKLVERGINVNSVYINNVTAIELACLYSSINVVNILLKAGAHANRGSESGTLNVYKSLRVLSVLTNTAADINAKAWESETALLMIDHLGSNYEMDYFVTCLHTFLKSIVNTKDSYNITSLYSAVLLDWVLDFNAVDKRGKTLLMSAMGYANGPEFIVKAIVVMESDQKIKISESNMILISEYFLDLYENCKREVEVLKKQTFWGKISFYDLLNSPLEVLSKYTSNSELMHVFNSSNWKLFPQYGRLMRSRMIFAQKVRRFFEGSVNTLNRLLCPAVHAPQHIFYSIVSFLQLDDMIKLASMTNRQI